MVLFHYWLEIKVNTNEVFRHYYKDELVGNYLVNRNLKKETFQEMTAKKTQSLQ